MTVLDFSVARFKLRIVAIIFYELSAVFGVLSKN